MTARPGPRQSRPRSEAHYGPERGDTYLIHFEERYKHAGHYTGWTDRPVLERFADHLAGRGAVLTRAVVQAGIRMKLARVWPDTTRDYEDALKHQGGAKRLCPDCGAPCRPPRLATGTPRPEADRRLPLWEIDRLGITSDGEPLPMGHGYAEAARYRAEHPVPEPDLNPEERAEQAALDELARSWTSKQEDPMTLRETIGRVFDRRGSAAERARQAERDRAHAEADRLAREADQIDMQAGRRPGQPIPLAAERAARIRDYIARDLVRDARAQAAAQAPEPALQGAELDAELARLAEAFPDAPADHPEMGEDYHTQPVGSARHRGAHREYLEATGGPRDGWTAEQEYAADHWADLEYDRQQAELEAKNAAEAEREGYEADRAEDFEMEDYPDDVSPEAPRPAAARWTPYPEDVTDPPWGRAEREADRQAADRLGELQEARMAQRRAEDRRMRAAGIDPGTDEDLREAVLDDLDAVAAAADPADVYTRYPVGSDEHRAAYEAMRERDAGIGYGGYEVDNAEELAAERYEEQADQHFRDMRARAAAGDREAAEALAELPEWLRADPEPEIEGPGAEPGPDAAQWSPSLEDPGAQAEEDLAAAAADHDRSLRFGRIAAAQAAMSGSAEERQLEQRDVRLNMSSRRAAEREAWIAAADMQQAAEREAPDHLYGAPECDEADPETAHFGPGSPEAQDRGHWALPHVLEPSEVSAIRSPEAAMLPDGTPHADPQQAARGWQAQGGVYTRAPQMQAEAV